MEKNLRAIIICLRGPEGDEFLGGSNLQVFFHRFDQLSHIFTVFGIHPVSSTDFVFDPNVMSFRDGHGRTISLGRRPRCVHCCQQIMRAPPICRILSILEDAYVR